MICYTWKGLWERMARTALTLAGVAVCVLALTTADGMLGHMHAERTQDLARFADRLLLQSPGAGYPPFKSVLREESVAPVINRPDVVADQGTPLLFLVLEPSDNPMDVAGIIGLGIWPGRERTWLGATQVRSGRATLAGEDEKAVILGNQAARFYGVSAAGQTVTFAGLRWRVVGILKETRMSNVDNLVVMPLASAQAAFDVEGWISAVLLTAGQGRTEALARSLADAYPKLEVHTQEDVHRILLKELELSDRFLGTLSWAAFIITVLLVANVMSIVVRERAEEVEPIRATGGRRPAILGYTLAESLMLSLGGGGLGALAAVPAAYIFGWTWILTWGEALRVAGLALVAGLLAGVYPAYRAARIYPQALRYDELHRQVEEISAERRAMNQAYRQLVRGREEEREKLSRELHDQAIQSLVCLKFHLAERAPYARVELQAGLDGVITMLHELCSDLRPPALDQLGLAAALRSYVDDFSARSGLPVELRVPQPGEERRLPPEVELALFRVAQEALTNAWKHAQAPKVEVDLWFDEKAVQLTIYDRGRGFAVLERLGALAEAGHFGLVGMHERMELIGGALRLTSASGQGTTIVAWVPLRSSE
ncbi:MAG: ABC transporter permease [Chloroflexi bacterium]|nr:ABC transporter permease [Chloroflexota bacterium]